MVDWTPEQRKCEVHRLLSSGRLVIAGQLARQWRCNEKTVRRLLNNMRDVDQLPIEFDRVAKTWKYTGKVAELQPMLIRAEDRRALLFSLQATAQLEGTPVCTAVRRLYELMLSTLPPEKATDFRRMMQAVRFTGPPTPEIKKHVWDVVLLSLEALETIHITYTDGLYGSTTKREIDPYGLLMRDRRWILVAYCHRRKDVLTFSLYRISEAASTDKRFTMAQTFMDQYLADAFDGYQTTGEKSKFVLRIRKDAPAYVQDRPWSENESRRADPAGNLIVEFQTAALFAVEREVLANGPWVEILEPLDCRQNMLTAAKALAAAHQ